MSEYTFAATGLTCGHCAAAVTEELAALEPVSSVHINLVPGAVSTVTVISTRPLTQGEVSTALDEAGDYRLAP